MMFMAALAQMGLWKDHVLIAATAFKWRFTYSKRFHC